MLSFSQAERGRGERGGQINCGADSTHFSRKPTETINLPIYIFHLFVFFIFLIVLLLRPIRKLPSTCLLISNKFAERECHQTIFMSPRIRSALSLYASSPTPGYYKQNPIYPSDAPSRRYFHRIHMRRRKYLECEILIGEQLNFCMTCE